MWVGELVLFKTNINNSKYCNYFTETLVYYIINCIFVSVNNQNINDMTIKEGNILIAKLRKEIEQGIDVEFNKQWIKCLSKSIANAMTKGYAEAMKSLA